MASPRMYATYQRPDFAYASGDRGPDLDTPQGAAEYAHEWDSIHSVSHRSEASGAGGLCGIFFTHERPECDGSAVEVDLGDPLPGPSVQVHASVLRESARWHVLGIPRPRDLPEISPPIVEFVPVDVVAAQRVAMLQTEKGAVQVDHTGDAVNDDLASDIPVGHQGPAPLTDVLSVGGIDQCVGSNAAIAGAERDTYGILGLHHDLPNPVRGVGPALVTTTSGPLAFNYTPLGGR